MEPFRNKDKRSEIRIPLLAERICFEHGGGELNADVGDITNEGIFLRTDRLLPPKANVSIKLSLPGDLGLLQIHGRVVRVNWAKSKKKSKEALGMGIQFDGVSPNIKKILDAYVVYLRNKQIITVSKRIIEEFFGNDNNGPKKLV